MPLNPRITDWPGQRRLAGRRLHRHRPRHRRAAARARRARWWSRRAARAALDAFVAAHPGSQALALDATDRAALRDAGGADRAQRHGRIDLAVYCAGHYKPMRATAFDLDDALRHQQINYVGALNLLDAVLPALLRQRRAAGHLSLVASVAGYRGLPKALAYGPTKAALINLAESLYLDLHRQGIGVSRGQPGLRGHAADGAERLPHAGADQRRRGGRGRSCAAGSAGEFEIHFPKRFTRWLKALQPARRRPVLRARCAASPGCERAPRHATRACSASSASSSAWRRPTLPRLARDLHRRRALQGPVQRGAGRGRDRSASSSHMFARAGASRASSSATSSCRATSAS